MDNKGAGSDTWARAQQPLRRQRTLTVLLALLVAVVAVYVWKHYTGGPTVESQVRSFTGDGSALCYRAGLIAFAGSQAKVYECSTGADYRCFVRSGGDLYEVTDQVAALKTLGAGAGFRCGG